MEVFWNTIEAKRKKNFNNLKNPNKQTNKNKNFRCRSEGEKIQPDPQIHGEMVILDFWREKKKFLHPSEE